MMANKNKYKELVLSYFKSSNELKELQKEQEAQKQKLYAEFDKYFELNKDEVEDERIIFEYPELGKNPFNEDGENTLILSIKQVQKSTVNFNVKKLEKVISKEHKNDVIKKKYEIYDMKSLTAYLKECGVDPKIFTSFISVIPSVDVKELDRLEQLGKIKLSDLKGCYSVKQGKPYYLITEKK